MEGQASQLEGDFPTVTELLGVGGAAPELRLSVKGKKSVKVTPGSKTPQATTFGSGKPAAPGSGVKTPKGKAATTFGPIKARKGK